MITADEQKMVLRRFDLGAGAIISFAPDVTAWEVWAEEAIFGEGSLIDARGSTGADGVHGAHGRSTNSPGHYGTKGEHGRPGQPGGRGVDLFFRMTLARFGGTRIDATGGAAGKGGSGGNGGKSGDARCSDRKKARNGEAGGNAGPGGRGGNGGDIDFIYRTERLMPFEDDGTELGEVDEVGSIAIGDLAVSGITLVSSGGVGGPPGDRAGTGGAGGHGKRCSAPYPHMGGGNAGANGHRPNQNGPDGAPGRTSVRKGDFPYVDGQALSGETPVYYDQAALP